MARGHVVDEVCWVQSPGWVCRGVAILLFVVLFVMLVKEMLVQHERFVLVM